MKSDEQKAATTTDLDKDYCAYYAEQEGGEYNYPGQVLYDMLQKDTVTTLTDYYLYLTLVQQPSEESLNIIAQCEQYMNVQGVKALMTTTDEEFDACKAETLAGLEAKNYGKATEEIAGLYEAAKTEADAFNLN